MDSKRLRLILIGVIALAVLGFGYALLTAIQKEDKQERWDILDKLRRDGEPAPDRDPMWFNPSGVLNPERAAYVRTLGQIDLIFAFIVSVVLFREKASARDVTGVALIAFGLALIVLG